MNDLPADSSYSDNQHKNIHDLKTVNSGVDYRKILLTETFIVLGWIFRDASYWDEKTKGMMNEFIISFIIPCKNHIKKAGK